MATASDLAVLRGRSTYKEESRPNQDMHTPFTSIVPAKMQDLGPSPSFTKLSIEKKKKNLNTKITESLRFKVLRTNSAQLLCSEDTGERCYKHKE